MTSHSHRKGQNPVSCRTGSSSGSHGNPCVHTEPPSLRLHKPPAAPRLDTAFAMTGLQPQDCGIGCQRWRFVAAPPATAQSQLGRQGVKLGPGAGAHECGTRMTTDTRGAADTEPQKWTHTATGKPSCQVSAPQTQRSQAAPLPCVRPQTRGRAHDPKGESNYRDSPDWFHL